MRMVARITPANRVVHKILRRKLSELNITKQTAVEIIEYRFANHARSISFKKLPQFSKSCHKVDILWEISLRFKQPAPGWQGMMHVLNKQCEHLGKSSVVFLPMIDLYPGDKTCIVSTLEYICKLAYEQNITPVVTFDQPLFWKASDVQQEVSDENPIQDVVLFLGGFHPFMNLLGAIGTLMDGSGLKDILETIYGENAVVHMMSGKAVQRSFRGHLLISQCLTNLIVSKIIDDEPKFQDYVEQIEKLYSQIESGEIGLDTFMTPVCLGTVSTALATRKEALCKCSETSKLWLNYQRMLEVAQELIEADRTGSWEMHLHAVSECLPIFAAAGHSNYLKSGYLYLQKISELESIKHAEVYQKFINSFHVVRRSNHYWAGLGSDLVVEQTLMRSLKSTGGLTRESGMTEHQRALWTMSTPISSAYNYATQDFSNTVSSEQHKEATPSRIERDRTDLQHSPFTEGQNLRNVNRNKCR